MVLTKCTELNRITLSRGLRSARGLIPRDVFPLAVLVAHVSMYSTWQGGQIHNRWDIAKFERSVARTSLFVHSSYSVGRRFPHESVVSRSLEGCTLYHI